MNLNGSVNNRFKWNKLENVSSEGFFLSSPGVRKDGVINLTIGTVYNQGEIDCAFAIKLNTMYQRPALS